MPSRKSPARKLEEMREAITLEKTMSKNQILEGYLNVAYFNNQVYGIQAAAKKYFSTTAANLTVPQAALLAGMVQDPLGYDPIAHAKAAKTRRDTVLLKMLQNKMLSQADYDKSVVTPLNLKLTMLTSGCSTAKAAAYFCDYVTRLITKDDRFASLGLPQPSASRPCPGAA